METLGPINIVGLQLLGDLEWRISQVSNDRRKNVCLFQRLSLLILQFIAVAIQETSVHTPTKHDIWPFQFFFWF